MYDTRVLKSWSRREPGPACLPALPFLLEKLPTAFCPAATRECSLIEETTVDSWLRQESNGEFE